MSGVNATNAPSEVEEAIAVHVFQPGVLCTRDIDRSGMRQATRHGALAALRDEDVTSPYLRCQAVRRIIGDLQRIFFFFERDHRCDWAKNVFAGNAGAVVSVIEDGRLDVVALGKLFGAAATNGYLGFLLS